MYIERAIEQTIRNATSTFPVLLVTGPRQVGKTTLLEHLAEPERTIVSLDNPTIRTLAKTDPELFLQRYAPPVLIDEVQYAPELFPYIKILADKRRHPGDFWLTGSQMFHMMKDVSESMAGRVAIVSMLGLSAAEIDGRLAGPFRINPQEMLSRLAGAEPRSVSQVFERIFAGSMPRLYQEPDINRQLYFESYLDTYLSRDIRDLDQVGDETAYMNFLRIVAARTATVVNYEAMAQEAGISAPTAKRWLSILVSGGIVVLIQPFANNALKRVVKSPRMYFLDTGLAAHLLGWSSPEVLEAGAMNGEFFETWVVAEIYKSFLNAGIRPPLYYYRDSNKKEIDLLIYEDGMVHPVEIKKASAPTKATKHFSVLKPLEADVEEHDESLGQKASVGTGAVVCMTADLLPIDRSNWLVPAWII